MKLPGYDRFPSLAAPPMPDSFWQGWESIVERVRGETSKGARLLAIECYPGVFVDEIVRVFAEALRPDLLLTAEACYRDPQEIACMVARDLTCDPVFGRMNGFTIHDWADPTLVAGQRARLSGSTGGLAIVIGTGTELLAASPGPAGLRRLATLGNPTALPRQPGLQLGGPQPGREPRVEIQARVLPRLARRGPHQEERAWNSGLPAGYDGPGVAQDGDRRSVSERAPASRHPPFPGGPFLRPGPVGRPVDARRLRPG